MSPDTFDARGLTVGSVVDSVVDGCVLGGLGFSLVVRGGEVVPGGEVGVTMGLVDDTTLLDLDPVCD